MTLADVASVATAVGLFAIFYQLGLTRRQLRAGFEQTFVDRYLAIAARIPLELILGETARLDAASERALYDYFELCEEELYYRRGGRVSRGTWLEWWDGIALNFMRPGFRAAWVGLKDRTILDDSSRPSGRLEQFDLLRAAVDAIAAGREHDPRSRSERRDQPR